MDIAKLLDQQFRFLPFQSDVGTFWHGTHVAVFVACWAGNGIVGIAQKLPLIGVSSRFINGSGAFEWILDGILYAATPQSQGGAGAQILNMSLGALLITEITGGEIGFQSMHLETLQKIYDRATRLCVSKWG